MTDKVTEQKPLELKPYATVLLYVGPNERKLLSRVNNLTKEHKTISKSGLFLAAMSVCIDVFEKEIPSHRKFKLNGFTVEV